MLVDAGGDILSLKRHGGWKSTTVAESYLEESIGNKISICNKILGLGGNQPSTSSTMNLTESDVGTSTQLPSTTAPSPNSHEQNFSPNSSLLPKISIENCKNCKIDIHVTNS